MVKGECSFESSVRLPCQKYARISFWMRITNCSMFQYFLYKSLFTNEEPNGKFYNKILWCLPHALWPMQDDDACAGWCGQVPLQVIWNAGYADVNGFEWSDVTIGSLSSWTWAGWEWGLFSLDSKTGQDFNFILFVFFIFLTMDQDGRFFFCGSVMRQEWKCTPVSASNLVEEHLIVFPVTVGGWHR